MPTRITSRNIWRHLLQVVETALLISLSARKPTASDTDRKHDPRVLCGSILSLLADKESTTHGKKVGEEEGRYQEDVNWR